MKKEEKSKIKKERSKKDIHKINNNKVESQKKISKNMLSQKKDKLVNKKLIVKIPQNEEEALYKTYVREMEEKQQKDSYHHPSKVQKMLAPKGKSRELKNKDKNKELFRITLVFTGLFIGMILYLIRFMAFESKTVINSPYNKRQDLLAAQIIRGEIISRDGKVLAYTKVEDDVEKRVYPYSNIFAHIVGRVDKGKTGIESSENFSLLTSNDYGIRKLLNDWSGEKNQGDKVITTLDTRLQEAAYKGLKNHNGTVVVMEPDSGKILAMVSKPNYDPNTIVEDWDSLVSGTIKSPLINRATQGLYPPGSIYKILTSIQYMRENENFSEYEYICTGTGIFNGVVINCYNKKAHGKINLVDSFAVSCNTSFANIGVQLNMDKFRQFNESFLFNAKLPTALSTKASSFVLNSKTDMGAIPQTVIGQGETLVTPLHTAMITSAIANGGVMMKPYVVDSVISANDNLIRKTIPQMYERVMTAKEAEIITSYMEAVVETGTATSLKGKDYEIVGKTGSAEFDKGKAAHAWFVGFAPADNPQVVISVLVEEVGTGSQHAVPIASVLFDIFFAP